MDARTEPRGRRRWSAGILAVPALAAVLPAQWSWTRLPEHPPIAEFAWAEDPVRQRVVLFGGMHRWFNTPVTDETWEWDGSSWQLRQPTNSPPARARASMAYDPVSRMVLLFGGHDDRGALFGDTWLWDGRDWRQAPVPGPPARAQHRMATDPVRDRIVLFGGIAGQFLLLSPAMQDTWEWDGTSWTQRFPVSLVPAARAWHGMAYDSVTGRVAMFGGCDGFARLPTAAPVEWDGTDWIQVPRTGGADPGFRCGLDAAPDPVTGGVFLYGGTDGRTIDDDLFLWNGSRWSLVTTGATPVRVNTDFLVADSARQQLVTYGAFEGPSGFASNCDEARQTWTFSPSSGSWTMSADGTRPLLARQVVHDSRRDCFWVLEQGSCNGMRNQTWKLTDDGFTLQPTTTTPLLLTAYHEASGLVVGHDGGAGLTWTFDGNDWQAVSHPVTPPWGEPAGYDSRRRLSLYFTPQQLWGWDPTGWRRLGPSVAALPGYSFNAAYDAARDRLVVLGVTTPGGPDTHWEWDGSTWQQITVPLPSNAGGSIFLYVPQLGGILWTGAQTLASVVWDGTTWNPITFRDPLPLDPNGPNVLVHMGMSAYDPNRRRVRALPSPLHAIWDLSLKSLTVSPPDPSPGATLTFAMDAPSEAGRPWLAGLSTALSPGIPLRPSPYYGTELLPLAPDPLLPLSLSFGLGGVLDAQGRGQATLPIPPRPSLAGLTFHSAAVTLGPGPSLGQITAPASIDVVR